MVQVFFTKLEGTRPYLPVRSTCPFIHPSPNEPTTIIMSPARGRQKQYSNMNLSKHIQMYYCPSAFTMYMHVEILTGQIFHRQVLDSANNYILDECAGVKKCCRQLVTFMYSFFGLTTQTLYFHSYQILKELHISVHAL